jgi:hypothetical protein
MSTPHNVQLRSFTPVPCQQEGSYRRSIRLEVTINIAQNKSFCRNPTPIEIRAQTSEDAETSRGAILSYDSGSENNIISHRLVTKVLGEHIHPLDDTIPAIARINTCGKEIGGYVDLEWCMENDRKHWHTSRFLVTTTYDPPYDAVLGRKDAEYYGMIRTRSRR